MAQQNKKFNPMLIIIPLVVGVVGVGFVCLVGLGLFFYFDASTTTVSDDTPTEATPAVEVVQFTAEPPAPEPTPLPPTNTPIPTPTLEPTPEPVVEEPTPEPQPEVTEPDPAAESAQAEEEQEPVEEEPAPVEEETAPVEPAPAVSVETEFPVPTINNGPVVMNSPDYSMQVFLFWQEEIADRDLQLVQDAGFPWVKQEFAWREIEGAGKGVFDWSRTDRIMNQIDAHGLKVIARLGVQPRWARPELFPEVGPPHNMQDFMDYIAELATRYKGRIDAYQIWNEPNLAREWGEQAPNPAEYTEMLRQAYQTIKAIDPNPIIISAGMAPTTRFDHVAMPDTYFIQGMYDAGAQPYFDALGAHGPGFKAPPETDPAEIANTPGLANPGDFENNVPEELRRVYGFRHIEDVRAIMVQNGDSAKQVVLLEFGWTVDPRPDSPYYWHAVTPIEQAQYFERAYAYAKANWQPWIGVMSLIYVANPRWTVNDEQTYWSIVYPGYPELNTAPAYEGLKKMPK